MKFTTVKFSILTLVMLSQSATAALFDLEFSGVVSANQTHNGVCPGQNGPGLNICRYFAIGDTINMTLRYDDTTPFYNLNYNSDHRVHDNAFTSLSLSSTSSSYSGYNGSASGQFGQFMVRDFAHDGYTIRLWESSANSFAYDTANDMDLTPLDTGLTFAADDALGDIIIRDMRINLTSLQNDLITSSQLPTSLDLSDFNDPVNTNWGFSAKNGLGFAASVGINLTSISVTAVSSSQNTGNNHLIPEPAMLTLFSLGLAGLGFFRKRQLQS